MNSQKVENIDYRLEHYVCKYCGGKLEKRLIIYNQYGGQGIDLYCPACGKVEFGIDPNLYMLAKAYVDKFEFNYYTDMQENIRNYQMNIAKVATICDWLKKHDKE